MAPSNPRALVATAVFAGLVTAGLVWQLPAHRAAAERQAVSAAEQSLLIAGNPFSADCIGVLVSVSDEDMDALSPLLAAYNAGSPKVDGRCVQVRVALSAPGSMVARLSKGWDEKASGREPTVWLPGSSLWLNLVRAASAARAAPIVLEPAPSLAQSPLVIAMPRPMAQALGWPAAEIGFADLVAIAQDPRGWGRAGHPEWGPIRLGKTSPISSTTGLQALVSAYFAASGISADLTSANLGDPHVLAFVHGVELATVHYGTTTTSFLTALSAADAAGGALDYVSAVALSEQQVLAYDARHPHVPLVAVYPKEGTLVSDSPFAVLASATAAERAGAADLLHFLQAPAQQAAFQAAGYRDAKGRAGSALTGSPAVLADHPKTIIKSPPSGVLAQVQSSWWKVRKPARVLVIVDVSGSMDDAVPGTGHTKLELAKAALGAAVAQVGDSDQVGLWTFSNTVDRVTDPVPMETGRAAVELHVLNLHASGGTALYDAVDRAITANPPVPGYATATVVLTDGEDNQSRTALAQLLTHERDRRPDAATRIFTIAYGLDANREVLSQIAEASWAESYDASNPALISEVFNALLSNF